jgi:hypothetical protein
MARKTIDTDKLIIYKHYEGELTAYPYNRKIEILTKDYEGFACSPAQARHIAKKLIQFADNIDKEIT